MSNQETKYKAGDIVITEGYHDDYDDRELEITEIFNGIYCKFKPNDSGLFKESHNFSLYDIVRKVSKPVEEKQPLKIDDLKEGVVLVSKESEFTVQGTMKDLVFCIDKNKSSKTRSIHQLIRDGYTIKQPETKYYMGFEVRSYEGEGIIVKTKIDNDNWCIAELKEVKKNYFIIANGTAWSSAVLATCNNHNIKLKA